MEDNNIRRYAKLMQELGLTGLEINEDGTALRLERTEQQHIITEPKKAVQIPLEKSVEDYIDICSPMVGAFYSSPAENAHPFVNVGDVVHKGDVICIIESMKLMNEITSDQNGIIAEVCVANGQVVDYGHVLFRIKKV
ncbi:hypothetical protein SDC9_87129 [bioreactor metagenome]|uniref:Biotin carboxyl carrier protein of acetyl-CoA carboxylase n=1 Tax=bioreactor metagenome TaxID=1076179 RepID=A0A644ZHV8_9ZZZZ|nr:biotin/lipoyl-containing protein [Candidatus Metalachnospira sp.]